MAEFYVLRAQRTRSPQAVSVAAGQMLARCGYPHHRLSACRIVGAAHTVVACSNMGSGSRQVRCSAPVAGGSSFRASPGTSATSTGRRRSGLAPSIASATARRNGAASSDREGSGGRRVSGEGQGWPRRNAQHLTPSPVRFLSPICRRPSAAVPARVTAAETAPLANGVLRMACR
jgi:hypothetical protein